MCTAKLALPAFLVSLLLAPFMTACSSRPAPATTTATGGHIGIPGGDTVPADLPPELISPAGRRIAPGTVDAYGYTLPLDVRWKRPPRQPPGAAVSRAQIQQRREERGASPFTEVRLGPDDGHTQNETSIAVAGSTLVAGWNNYTASELVMGVGRSTNGGATWTFQLFEEQAVTSDPAVKAGGGGRWYYVYLGAPVVNTSQIEILIRRSDDDGASWSLPVKVTNNSIFDDKPYLAAAGDEVVVAWSDFSFSPAKVRVARSLNGGTSFGGNTILANSSVGGNGACPVIDAAGNYYVFWRDSFQDFLWMAKSTDQGTSWSPDVAIVEMNPLPTPAPGGFRVVNLPSAAADPTTGTLVVVWNDQRFGNPDILSIRSTDGGATWSDPVRVNDDAGTAMQFFPWVEIDDLGIVHVTWYDRRHNGSDIDVYYTRSFDGGASYEPNLRVTAESFTPILPWDTTVPFIGDYNGIAAQGGTAYPFYQDSREGNQDVWVAVIPGRLIFRDGFESGDTSVWSAVVDPP